MTIYELFYSIAEPANIGFDEILHLAAVCSFYEYLLLLYWHLVNTTINIDTTTRNFLRGTWEATRHLEIAAGIGCSHTYIPVRYYT